MSSLQVILLGALGVLLAGCTGSSSAAPTALAAPAPALLVAARGEQPEFTGQRVVQWVGRATGLRYTQRNAGYYTADEFAFIFSSPRNGRWQVISREPTPFEMWRFGTTFTGLKVDWNAGPEVRLTGVKGVDRIPASYPGLTLDAEKTITALILEVRVGEDWRPWYVNNWFHKWSTPEDDARIAAEYAGKSDPYEVYGFRDDAPAELTAASRAVVERFPTWRAYHGVLVRDPTAKGGIALEIRHLFAKDPKTGGNACVYGDPKALIPLSRQTAIVDGQPFIPGAPSANASPGTDPLPTAGGAGAEAPTGWWMAGGGPEHRGDAPSLVPPLRPVWQVAGGKEFAGGPVAAGGRVYIGNNDGNVYCFDAVTGKEVWTFKTGAEVEATPTLWGGMVLVGSFDGNVYAVDAVSGRERWRFSTGPRMPGVKGIDTVKQGVDSSIAVVDGSAYFGAWDGKAYCLDARTGQQRWSRQLGGIVHWSAPAVSGGKVVLGATDGKLYCLNAGDGAVSWATELAAANMDHMMCGPSIADGVVYSGGGYENGLYALGLADGKVRWKYAAKSLVCSSPAIRGNRLYAFADGGGQVFCLDRNSGKELWSRTFGGGWGACNPVLSGGAVYLTMRDGKDGAKAVSLVALDTATGATLWTYSGGGAWAGPAIADNRLYYGSDDGKLRAFAR